jgi:phosphoribosylformylglycinamidine (FGAM) synthase-like amidotransferase family enzyme
VVTFPGSNDDRDALRAVECMGGTGVPLWHGDAELGEVDAVILPGGFSYGDYLRTGAIARIAPMLGAVREFAERGGPVLGICNGFQILCEAGLLPGALIRNRSLRFVCRFVDIRVETTSTPITWESQRSRSPSSTGRASSSAPTRSSAGSGRRSSSCSATSRRRARSTATRTRTGASTRSPVSATTAGTSSA